MSAQEIDDYLAGAPEPQATTLRALRATVEALLPDAEPGIAYGIPAYKVDGRGVAGFSFSQALCSYFPMSGSITAQLADRLAGYATAKGSIRFAADVPLPADLIAELVAARREEIARTGR
jgi:uncharacterized protein YdhG (YjbR/CyaY superfamily)